jgi:hypothetical protein
MEWAEKGVRKEDHLLPHLARLAKKNAYGVSFLFKSMEQGRPFASVCPNTPPPISTTAFWPRSAAVSRIITSTSGMRFWAQSHCA